MTGSAIEPSIESILRGCGPQVLGALTRRYGQFEAAEDAVQEALLAAATQWPASGIPDNPRGWLLTVASRRLTDDWRSDAARRRRETDTAVREQPLATADPVAATDDTLALLFLCCHPALTPASQVCLTLRAVGGLSTAEVAAAFMVPESTMAQRISRSKQKIRAAGSTFSMPSAQDRGQRLATVLQVLYLIFNEGYTALSGSALSRAELSDEAIRLTRLVQQTLPDDGEVAGLLALMLLTDSRRPARTTADGSLVPLAEQDRSRWNRSKIDRARTLLAATLPRAALGPYQLQAAIAAVHADAATADETDWRQISALYRLLDALEDNPMVTLNRAVAVAMAQGAQAGLELLTTLEADERVTAGHRLPAARAHLLELDGRIAEAAATYREAARRATSLPEQRYLRARADRL